MGDPLPFHTGTKAARCHAAGSPLPSREDSQGARSWSTARGRKRTHWEGRGQRPGEAPERNRVPKMRHSSGAVSAGVSTSPSDGGGGVHGACAASSLWKWASSSASDAYTLARGAPMRRKNWRGRRFRRSGSS